jgi:uncharacterized OB-fold protein/acyl dehydratase
MTYIEQLKALIGVPGETSVARYPVSEAMIHHWCDAIGDENPIYTDAQAAAAQGLAGPVAPLTMLQAWTMPGLKPVQEVPGTDMVRIFEEAGFTGVVATNCDQQYARYVRPGDVIHSRQQLESVSDLKKTALGEGHFVTQVWSYSDADDQVVGTMRFRMLFFRPRAAPPAAPTKAKRPRPAMTRDTEFFWKGAEEGVLLLQRCADCEEFRHPPGPMCPRCRSLRWNAVESSGRGVIYSYVRHYHPHIPPFEPGHPIVLVELEEGVRIVADLIGEGSETPSIGQPVAVELNRVDDDLVLPQFRIRKE